MKKFKFKCEIFEYDERYYNATQIVSIEEDRYNDFMCYIYFSNKNSLWIEKDFLSELIEEEVTNEKI